MNVSSNLGMHDKVKEIKRLIPQDIESARESAALLLASIEDSGNDAEKAEVYHLIGLVHFYADESRDAVKWYNKELKLRKKSKDLKGASNALNNIGAIYYQTGKLDKAIEQYRRALAYRESINDRRGVAGSYDNIGVVLFRSGRATEALDMHFRALKINQDLGDTERSGFSLQNIGQAYFSQGDYVYAFENYKESLAIAEKTSDNIRAVQLMINIGSTLLMQGNIQKAKEYYEHCYDKSQTIYYQHGLILSLHNLGDIEMRESHYEESIRHYTDCILIAKTTGHVAETVTAMTGIARSYIHLSDYKQGLKYLNEALVIAKKTAIKESLRDIYILLSEVHDKKGDLKKAFQYFKEHIALRDHLVNTETTRTIHEIKYRFEVEKKEKEAEINRLKHIELKNALDALTESKKQSDELLLNILPDDVAEELKAKGSVTARYFEQAAVIFIDVKDFTRLSEHLSPQELVSIIDVYFSLFDSVIGEYAIEKIKTIGDAYLCAAGLPVSDPDSAFVAVRASLHIRDMIAKMNKMRRENGLLTFEFRFGVHVGPIIAGVVGRKKFEYDIWGDTVNTAARMEQNSEEGRINISGQTYELIKGSFECTYRGRIDAKNKGPMDMYFVEREIVR